MISAKLYKMFDSRFISLAGKATLLELKMKLLLDRDGHKVQGISCSKAKEMLYKNYSQFICDQDKKNIDTAVWIRNKLVHSEFSEVFKKQSSISSRVVEAKIKGRRVMEAIKNVQEGRIPVVSETSHLYGQYLEIAINPERIKNLVEGLDKAIEIITRVVDDTCRQLSDKIP